MSHLQDAIKRWDNEESVTVQELGEFVELARRQLNLTSPETITEIAQMLNDWYPPSKHPLMDAVKYQSQAKAIVERLRSVEEGTE